MLSGLLADMSIRVFSAYLLCEADHTPKVNSNRGSLIWSRSSRLARDPLHSAGDPCRRLGGGRELRRRPLHQAQGGPGVVNESVWALKRLPKGALLRPLAPSSTSSGARELLLHDKCNRQYPKRASIATEEMAQHFMSALASHICDNLFGKREHYNTQS